MAVDFKRILIDTRNRIKAGVDRVKAKPLNEYFLPTSTPFKQVAGGYAKGQVINQVKEGVGKAVAKDSSPLQRAGGVLQAVGGGFNATPAGVGYNAITSGLTTGAKVLRGKTKDPVNDLAKNFTRPTSFAQEGLDIKNPLIGLGVDVLAGNPKGVASSIKNISKIGKTAAKSSFQLDTKTYDEIIEAEKVLANPQKYIQSTGGHFPTPEHMTDAVNKAQSQALETVDRLAAKYLPDKVLNKVAGDPKKTIKALVDLHGKNKLANVPGMGFVDEGTAVAQPAEQAVQQTGKLEAGGGKYNISDFDFSPDTKKIFTDTAKHSEDLINIERRGKITFDQTRKNAEELFGMSAETLKKKKAGRVLNDAEITKAGDIAKTFFETELAPLQKSYDEALKAGTSNIQMKAQLLDKMNEGAIIQAKVLGARSELGRALNASKILKEAMTDPNQLKIEKVISQLGGEEKVDDILKKFNELSLDDPTGVKAYEFVRSMNKPNFADKVEWYWMNSILSGPRTHEKNLISNAIMVTLRPVDKVFSAVADLERVGVGKLIGQDVKRERYFGEAAAEVLSMRRGFVDGLGKFLHIMKNGYSLEDVGKLEVQRVEPVGKIAGATIGAPLRLLSASDQLFKSIIFNMESSAVAYRKAAQEGVPLFKRAERMTDILRDAPADLIDSASKAALKGTFQTEFAEGTLSKRISNLRNWEVKGVKPLKFVIPFIQTPINVMKIGLERGPVTGPLKGIWDTLRTEGGEQSDALGRVLLSGTTLGALGMLAMEGRISGNGPKNQKDLDLLRETGWQPNSIRLTNPKTGKSMWVSYKGIAPLDQQFAQVASLHERFVFDKEAPTEEKVFGIFTDILKNINDQTFTSGLADWLEALNNPESLSTSKFFSRLGASFVVPNILRTAAQTQDRVLRESNTFIQQLQTGVPGLSQDVPARLSEYDVPIVFEGNALLPTSVTSEQLPTYTTRETLQIRENVRKANKELEQGKAPSSLDKGRGAFVTAEYIHSKYKTLDTQEEVSAFVKDLKEKGLVDKDVAQMVDRIDEMDTAGLTKADREMFLYPPGAVRAQLIIDRYKQFTKPETAESYLATMSESGLLDETTGDALRTLNRIRKDKRSKAGL